MRLTISAFCATALLAACNNAPRGERDADQNAGGQSAAAEATDYFTVRPGTVSNARITALAGEFQMLKVAAANGIPSSGMGGACLVVAAVDMGLQNRSCTTNQQCQDPGAAAAYCETKTNSCWVRPKADPRGDKTCNRPVTMTPTTLNPVPKQPVDATPLGVKPGAKVRVVACLNTGGPPFPNNRPPCSLVDSADRIEEFGPVATVKP